jgi:predicted nucleotidyltransferase
MTGRLSLHPDLKELLELFQSQGVEFMVVGAHALAIHARPRFTEDLDLFVERSSENARRIFSSLASFGVLADEAEMQRFANDPRAMIVLGAKPNQVEILNFLDGVEFEEAHSRAVQADLGGITAPIISRDDFIATKVASGRAKDLADLALLRESEHSAE